MELFVDKDIYLPEHLYLPNLETIWVHFNIGENGEETDEAHKVVIPESVNFPNLQSIIVFPDENDDYDIKVPNRFANIVETLRQD